MARNLDDIEHLVRIGAEERSLLAGATRPIVLLRRRTEAREVLVEEVPGAPRPADSVAPGSPDLGVMLPYTPCTTCCSVCPATPRGPGCSS